VDVGPDVIADRFGVPSSAPRQPLHRPGPGVTGLSGRTPAVLPLDAGQQGEHEGVGGRPRLHPPEPARDPGHGLSWGWASGKGPA
jgi:hypothetical protein